MPCDELKSEITGAELKPEITAAEFKSEITDAVAGVCDVPIPLFDITVSSTISFCRRAHVQRDA